MKNICALYPKAIHGLETYLEPVVLLLIRLKIADFFFASGKIKLDTWLNDNWQATVDLFTTVHPVPYLPAEIAAPMSMASEVGFSVLLALGLFGRFTAFALLGVTGVIFITHQANFEELGAFIEAPWVTLLLLVVLVRGSGCVSVDTVVRKLMCKQERNA